MPDVPPASRGTSGCARALFILIAGVALVAALAWVTKDKPDTEDIPETAEAKLVEDNPAPDVRMTPLVDIPALAGKDPDEVEHVLGRPVLSGPVGNGRRAVYKGDPLKRAETGSASKYPPEVEIIFISGKADWITVTPVNDIPFRKDVLAYLGIPAAEPTFSNETTIRWEPCGDYASVSVFPKDGNRVDYAYIKVVTK